MKRKQYETVYPDPWGQDTYQTGCTNPPKQNSDLVAVLMVMVIFLAGLVGISGFLNLKMFSALYQSQTDGVPLALENCAETDGLISTGEDALHITNSAPGIAITGDHINPVYRSHFRLPEGLFITDVAEGSDADLQGLQEGDVLISLNDRKITDQNSLNTLVSTMTVGDQVEAVVYRHADGRKLTVRLTIEEITE